MNLNKQGVLWLLSVFVVMTFVLCCVCYCSPVSYRDDIVQVTTTPKTYKDRFTFNLQHKTKPTGPPNDSYADNNDEPHERGFGGRNRQLENEQYTKVKSVLPGEKTLRQSDEDDDDDDDGGEYEGVDYSCDEKSDRKKLPQCSRPDAAEKDVHKGMAAMPMMFIRELDMVAVQIPVKGPRNPESSQEWSEWSPCSRPCRGGKGLQSRWRVQHGVQNKEQQFRPCYLADCSSRDSPQFRPYFP